ncbi:MULTISPECIES: alpha/beta hydrolase [Streptomyces]|uniref:Alpha/beta hydrolase n=2 Tax=Streptomyces TaxID=1883 RepID=A0A3S9PDH0_STRLT|nr:alpha/beta hydrolase [Streptomyces luteoverticillatus]AZQ70231.1 alpha/beta hydrolase [Streptomyces luteoverticillatus]
MTRYSRGRAVAAALATVLALIAAPRTAVAAPAAQPLSWGSCVRGPDDSAGRELEAAGARCARLAVPLDHTRPGGRTVTVALARIPAADTAHRIGTLVVNEGGPGDPVIDFLPARRTALGATGARFDLVGVDPRFTGRSTPLDCGWETGSYFRSAGHDRAGFRRTAAFEQDLARRCRTRADARDLLPHASTRNVARDLELVRAALGEQRLSYLGISYGTYLGEVYTAMFPGRTDRMVLDGVHEPGHLAPWPEYGTESANEAALRHWAAWAAARNGTYGLGASADDVLATVAGIAGASAHRPLRVGDYLLDEHVVPVLFYGVLGADTEATDAQIAVMTGTLKKAATEGRAEPDPALAELLPSLLSAQSSAYASAQTAFLCADTPGPHDAEVFWHAVQRSRHRHPLFGPLLNNTTPCAFWDPPREGPTTVDGDTPALMLNATGDPRVPYNEAQAMHTRWPSSRMITVTDSFRHAVYGTDYGNACVNDAVNAYLASGNLPPTDLKCTAGRPDRVDSMRTTSADVVRPTIVNGTELGHLDGLREWLRLPHR